MPLPYKNTFKCLGQADVADYSSGKSWVGRFNSCRVCFYMVQDCSQDTAMACDRLRGVLVAQQKGVPVERLAGLVNGESGSRVGFESRSISL